jgi:multicomponent Na+:H+ antiporter subunit G
VNVVVDGASWICLVAGTAFCIIGAAGLIRMPDFYTRMHAASVTDTVGAGLILFGLMVQAGFTLVTAKLVIIAMLILLTSPAASHALARAAFVRGVRPLLHDGNPAPWKA